jgi:hypothetical protein
VKPVTYIFLASAILLQSLSSLVIIAGYNINKAYIASAFCENKDKPMMRCNGKCQLKKQLTEESEKDKVPSSARDKTEITQFYESSPECFFDGNKKITTVVVPESRLPAQDFHPLIFHPPSA